MKTPTALEQFIAARPFGFLDSKQLETLVALNRLQLVLCRFGGCRLLCPAQDAAQIIKALEAAGDYIRDVSIPSNDLAEARAACGFGDHTGQPQPDYMDLERQHRWNRGGVCRDCGAPFTDHKEPSLRCPGESDPGRTWKGRL